MRWHVVTAPDDTWAIVGQAGDDVLVGFPSLGGSKMRPTGFVVALALVLVAAVTVAEGSWEQLPADPEFMYAVGSMLDLAGPVTGEAADDFLFDNGSVISAVEWWGIHAAEYCGAPQYFTIRFYEDVPGPPFSHPADDPPVYEEVLSGFVQVWEEEYERFYYYAVLTSPFYPEAGTVYWISIQGAVTDAMDCGWYWCNSLDYWNDEAVWRSDYEHEYWYSPDWTPYSVHTGGVGYAYYVELAFRLIWEPASPVEGLSWGNIKALFR